MHNSLDSESSFLTVQPHFNLARFRKTLAFRTTIYSFRPRGSHYSDNMLLRHPELAKRLQCPFQSALSGLKKSRIR
jgi:hypothetical protein